MVLLGPGVTLVSRNGMEPSGPGSSTVNCMLGSCELMYYSSCWLCSAFWMTRVSSTNLNQRLGVEGRLEGFGFKLFHEQVCYEGADGGTQGCTINLFIVLTLEEEVGVFEAELQECDNLGNGHLGPLGECWVLCEFLLNYGDCWDH